MEIFHISNIVAKRKSQIMQKISWDEEEKRKWRQLLGSSLKRRKQVETFLNSTDDSRPESINNSLIRLKNGK